MIEYSRVCPQCQSKIVYSSKITLNRGISRNTNCKCCLNKSASIAVKNKIASGNYINGFLGKKHSEETKRISSIRKKGKPINMTDEYRKRLTDQMKSDKNPMIGSSVFNIWVRKHGLEKAQELNAACSEKKRIASTGKNNPMYGRPSPNKSGNGWRGYYNGKFFRSLRELSYMIFLDNMRIQYQSAEHIKIPYIDYKNSDRTYRPDFIINNTHVVEIKPRRMINTPLIILKFNALIKWCEENNKTCEIRDFDINRSEILRLYTSGNIIPLDKDKHKFDSIVGDTPNNI